MEWIWDCDLYKLNLDISYRNRISSISIKTGGTIVIKHTSLSGASEKRSKLGVAARLHECTLASPWIVHCMKLLEVSLNHSYGVSFVLHIYFDCSCIVGWLSIVGAKKRQIYQHFPIDESSLNKIISSSTPDWYHISNHLRGFNNGEQWTVLCRKQVGIVFFNYQNHI